MIVARDIKQVYNDPHGNPRKAAQGVAGYGLKDLLTKKTL